MSRYAGVAGRSLSRATKIVEDGVDEKLAYILLPKPTLERVNREIKCRTKAIGAFSDGRSGLMFVCARLGHVAGSA